MEVFKSSRRCGIDNCRSRRYHIADDGFTYCENSHRQDVGLVVGDDDYRPGASQAYAETTRARREEREVEPTHLEGRDAIILYLQCFQLILRKQVAWLVTVKKYPKELQTVVRDLWTLRVQMLQSIIEAPNEARSQQLFSTQTDTEDSDREYNSSSAMQKRLRRKAPAILETLALCYLGLVLMHIPICSGQIHEWVASEEFVFLHIPRHLPHSMLSKLPPALKFSLQIRSLESSLETLHRKILNLVWGFRGSFGLEVPMLNRELLLFYFVTSLSLPLDVFVFAETLAELLDYNFQFPPRPSRGRTVRQLQQPEVRLMATMVATVKLLYPFDSNKVMRYPTTSDSPSALVINWEAWNHARAEQLQPATDNSPKIKPQQSKIGAALNPMMATTEYDAMQMSKENIDSYLTWFNSTWIDLPRDEDGKETGHASATVPKRSESSAKIEFRKSLFKLFPTDIPTTGEEPVMPGEEVEMDTASEPGNFTEDPEPDIPLEPQLEMIKSTQSSLLYRKPIPPTAADDEELELKLYGQKGKRKRGAPKPEEGPLRPGAQYKHYRAIDEVPEEGQAFYAEAARLVGLDAQGLVRVVFKVELDMSQWVERQKKEQLELLRLRDDAAGAVDTSESS